MNARQHGTRWLRQAWGEFGWRDVGLALVVTLLLLSTGFNGGFFLIPLHEGVNPLADPGKHYVGTFLVHLFSEALPLVYFVRVAEHAIADRAPPWLAYLLVLLAVAVWAQAFRMLPLPALNRSTEHVGRHAWFVLRWLMQGGTGLAIYAYWRSSQRALKLAQASESQRARDLQRLRSAQLLALQARVDPQLLFNALRRVGLLRRQEPARADTLLTDLIALLRTMLPRVASTGSTVGREFAVVEAWLRVTGTLSTTPPEVRVDTDPGIDGASLAPMLALPLLRAVLDVPGAARIAWHLAVESAGARLIVTLGAPAADAPLVAAVLDRAELAGLRERIALLHGDAARLWVSRVPPLLSLDLPLAFDDGADEALVADNNNDDVNPRR